MIDFKHGLVVEILGKKPGICELLVNTEDSLEKAVSYPALTGEVEIGDQVVLNTTAVSKGLGTGGYHFVAAVEGKNHRCSNKKGHIMKLRYTPFQIKTLTVEEEEHPDHLLFRSATSLDNLPVLVGSLHSMVGPAAAALKHLTGCKIFYLMTDGGALPLWFSRLADELKEKEIIHQVVTCGHAFGGDFEAVNVYSGLLFAKAAGADAVIVAMGPGIIGTASRYGHTGLEQGEIINAVNILGGKAIAIPRISFADSRSRHWGLSHHTGTALGKIALTPCTVPVPLWENERREILFDQLKKYGIEMLHQVIEEDTSLLPYILEQSQLSVTTMGRSIKEDPSFFHAAGAAGIYTAKLMKTMSDEFFNGTFRSVPTKKSHQFRYPPDEEYSFSGHV